MFKKVLLLITFFLTIPVYAKDDTLYLTKQKDAIYYDERFIDTSLLRMEVDTKKNETYETSFKVENATGEDQKIYLLMDSKSEDGTFNELLESVAVQVTYQNKVVYDGTASIFNDSGNSKELNGFIYLGNIKKNEGDTLKILFNVSDSYYKESNNSYAYVSFSFYTLNKKKEYIEIETLTPEMFYNYLSVWIFCCFCAIVGLFILFMPLIRKKIHLPEIHLKKKKEDENKEKENS